MPAAIAAPTVNTIQINPMTENGIMGFTVTPSLLSSHASCGVLATAATERNATLRAARLSGLRSPPPEAWVCR
jgi:hypothetical protein